MRLSLGKFNPENEMKMKTINYFSIAFAGLAMFCSCNMEEMETISPETDGNAPALVAGEGQIVGKTPQMTKTALGSLTDDGTYPVVWLDQDQIKVYGESNTDGVIYTASVSESEAATTAIFSAPSLGESVQDATRYAVYPSSLAGAMDADGKIAVDLTKLRRQEYHSSIRYFGTYDNYKLPVDKDGNVQEEYKDMVQKEYYETHTVFPHLSLWAKAVDGSSQFTFQNLMGVVKLAMNDYQGAGLKIKEVKMTAKSPISGTMTVDAEGNVSVTGDDADANTVTIFSEKGVNIASSTPGLHSAGSAFLFFIPVGTYNGFDFEITTTDGRIFRKSTETVVKVEPGIVKKFPVLNFTLFYGKANCYQIANASSVEIDITPRYSFDMTFNGADVEYVEGAEPTFTPEIVWNLTRNGQNLKGTALTGTPTVNGNVLTVNSNAQGNGLVAIKDASGKIVWSYHIWVVNPTEHPVRDVKYEVGTSSFYMMSHNLGGIYDAVGSANNAYNTYGMFYQWGRKDPLPAYGTSTYSNGVTALFNSVVNQNNSIADAIANPLTMFINYKEDVKDGRNMSVPFVPQDASSNCLWGATDALTTGVDNTTEHAGFVKTVYDPCPEGYMVPQIYHFSGLSVAVTARTGYGALLYYNSAKDEQIYYPLPGVFLATDDIVSGTTKTQGCGGSIRCHVSNPVGTTGWAAAYFRAKYEKPAASLDAIVSLDKNYGGLANACSVRCLKMPTAQAE